ncbi:MAG: endonuclease III [Ignavibacteria bacterium]|nr:endonuclease III [Ignavibacteria bacterium]
MKLVSQKIRKIIKLLEKEFPDTKPYISKTDPLDVLIATILSQNTTDKASFRAYENLKKDFRSWREVKNAPVRHIARSIKTCGLGNQKAKAIKKLLNKISDSNKELSLNDIRDLDNEEIYKKLLGFEGVGIKTVSCVLAFGLGRDVFPVDTHVHRIVNRLGLVKTSSPDKTFYEIKDLIPDGKKFLFHRLLIRYGRKICRASRPLCGRCRLYELCEFPYKSQFINLNDSSIPKENNFIILEHV